MGLVVTKKGEENPKIKNIRLHDFKNHDSPPTFSLGIIFIKFLSNAYIASLKPIIS